MSVISISSGISGYTRTEDIRPKQVSMKDQAAIASKTLTYEEQEEIDNFDDVIESLSNEDQDAVEEYLEDTLEKMRNGETDMDKLVEDAPDALKAALEAEGIDLASVLENVSEHSPENAGVDMQMDENVTLIQQATSTLGDADQNEAAQFMQTVMDKIHSGKFDADELADDAPLALAKALEEQGADLKTMLSGINDKFLSFSAATDYSTALFSRLSNNLSIGGDNRPE